MIYLVIKIKQKLFYCFSYFLSLIAGGTKCVVCGNFSPLIQVCSICKEKYFLPFENKTTKRCSKCGKILISEKETCIRCRNDTVLIHTDKVISIFPYALWNKNLLFNWKIKDGRILSYFFAEHIDNVLKNSAKDFFIVPVPPRKSKIRKRGWDQIAELSSILMFQYNYKVCNILERVSSEEQKHLGRLGRINSIKNAYILKSGKKLNSALKVCDYVIPNKVVLIDDVMTTGATIESCANILKLSGVSVVDVVVLFSA